MEADRNDRVIDFHHHAVTEGYRDAILSRAAGTHVAAGLPIWQPDASISWMDSVGIERALLSPAARGFGLDDPEWTALLTSDTHDELLAVRERRPERFGVLTPLPLPSLERTLRHAESALLRDGVDGVVLLTQYAGQYLGDPAWDELLDLLNREAALVHVHPTAPTTWPARDVIRPGLLEYPFDTTRAILLLARQRAFSRFPRVRWVFAHGGGTLPFLIDRLAEPEGTIDGTELISAMLQNSFFDTALLGPAALAATIKFAGAERIVFGSDLPFIRADRVQRLLDEVSASFTDESARSAVRRTTALRLLETGRTARTPASVRRSGYKDC